MPHIRSSGRKALWLCIEESPSLPSGKRRIKVSFKD